MLGLLLVAGILGGCSNTMEKNTEVRNIKVELTSEEIAKIKDKKVGANLLVQKAVKKEMLEHTYNEMELKNLENTLEQIQMEYYLNNIS